MAKSKKLNINNVQEKSKIVMNKNTRGSGVNIEKLKLALKDIEKEYGEGSVYTIGSKKANMHIPRWSTGIEDLDEITGGGIPYGRIIEIYGAESAGKTTLAYHLMAQHDTAIDIPIEGTFDAKRAEMFGNRKGQLFIRQADCGEECFEVIYQMAELNVPCIVIDSVPSMLIKDDIEEADVYKNGKVGGIAGLMARNLPKVTRIIEKSGTTVIFVNQLRDEMGAALFGPKTHTPGGRALRHANSIRLEVRRKGWIKIPNKNPMNSAIDEIIGIEMIVKVTKSKVCNPLGECKLSLIYDRGFVPNSDVKEIREEIMKERRETLKKLRKRKELVSPKTLKEEIDSGYEVEDYE